MGNKIQYAFQWQVASSQSIHVIADPWLSNIPFIAWLTFLNMDHIEEFQSVSELINPDQIWNKNLLSNLFSIEMMNHVKRIPIVQKSWSDQLTWAQSNSSAPTIRLPSLDFSCF